MQESAESFRRPKPARSQRRHPKPRSLVGSGSENATSEALVTNLEEWPLGDVVLKRVKGQGMTIFQLEFRWNAFADHVQPHRIPESLQSKSPSERTPLTRRLLHSRVVSTAEKVREGEYFPVEDTLDFRIEYVVKWEGYGHEHDSWEPVTHVERCPEMLKQFHRKAVLSRR